jgi:hypothetical protein
VLRETRRQSRLSNLKKIQSRPPLGRPRRRRQRRRTTRRRRMRRRRRRGRERRRRRMMMRGSRAICGRWPCFHTRRPR